MRGVHSEEPYRTREMRSLRQPQIHTDHRPKQFCTSITEREHSKQNNWYLSAYGSKPFQRVHCAITIVTECPDGNTTAGGKSCRGKDEWQYYDCQLGLRHLHLSQCCQWSSLCYLCCRPRWQAGTRPGAGTGTGPTSTATLQYWERDGTDLQSTARAGV
jgi:hypothetical protein